MIEMVQFFLAMLVCIGQRFQVSKLSTFGRVRNRMDEPSNNSFTHCACSPVRPFARPHVRSFSNTLYPSTHIPILHPAMPDLNLLSAAHGYVAAV